MAIDRNTVSSEVWEPDETIDYEALARKWFMIDEEWNVVIIPETD